MLDLVGNPKDRFSHDKAHKIGQSDSLSYIFHPSFRFPPVRKTFLLELRELKLRDQTPYTAQSTISLLMGLKFFRVKVNVAIPFSSTSLSQSNKRGTVKLPETFISDQIDILTSWSK